MTDRRYYSERMGRGPATASLDFREVLRIFRDYFSHLDREGYFQETLGYHCVDDGYVAGTVGTDLETELELTLNKPELWPVHSTVFDWSEDDLFDVIEFCRDHVSKPTQRDFHSYAKCGWHCTHFDRSAGQQEFRTHMNRLLRRYDTGFELSEDGEVLALAPSGLEPLLDAEPPHDDAVNVGARIAAAVRQFRYHRATVDSRRDAVRNLVDVLEFIRPQIKAVLSSQDEADLFSLANNFGLRHHRPGQKSDYDLEIFLDWLFFYYLAAVHASLRLLERQRKRLSDPPTANSLTASSDPRVTPC